MKRENCWCFQHPQALRAAQPQKSIPPPASPTLCLPPPCMKPRHSVWIRSRLRAFLVTNYSNYVFAVCPFTGSSLRCFGDTGLFTYLIYRPVNLQANLLPMTGRLRLSNEATSLNYFKWDWKLESLLSKFSTHNVCHFDLWWHEMSFQAAMLDGNLLPTHSPLQVTPPTPDGGAQNPSTWVLLRWQEMLTGCLSLGFHSHANDVSCSNHCYQKSFNFKVS